MYYGADMSQKQNPLDLALLATGLALIAGSFSPWITIAVMQISGIDGWRGYVTLVSGVILMVYAATRLWRNILDERFVSKLGILSVVLLTSSLGVLVEIAVRLSQVTSELSDINSGTGSTTSTDTVLGDFSQALEDFTKSLTDALKPSLAIGWYICVLSVVGAGALMFVRRSSTPSVDVTP